MKNLLIIEGAGKIKKIKSFLGTSFDVMATGGHFRELDSTGLYNTGINTNYEPEFKISASGAKN